MKTIENCEETQSFYLNEMETVKNQMMSVKTSITYNRI
jgi:hypothetical protein